MYIDDSGAPNFSDLTKYYVLSGIIVKDENIKKIKKIVFDFKHEFFRNSYLEAEIHTHDLFRSKNEFVDLDGREKYKLLDRLYKMISELQITVISTVVDKPNMKKQYPNWKISKIGWIILLKRYNTYLQNNIGSKGIIQIDASTPKQRDEINSILENLRNEKQKYRRIDNVVEEPKFVNSHGIEGIQIADAVAYCTIRKMGGNRKFPPFWDLIVDKYYHHEGKLLGYGLNVFPAIDKIPYEDIQP